MSLARLVAENALVVVLVGYFVAALAFGVLGYRAARWVDRRYLTEE